MKLLLAFVYLVSTLGLYAQKSVYAVSLKPKQYSRLALSTESIARKKRLGIAIDDRDYAVDRDRLDKLTLYGNILQVSNWLNTIIVEASAEEIGKMARLDFVSRIGGIRTGISNLKYQQEKLEATYTSSEYGDAYKQIQMHHGESLHSVGFQGQGMRIAVFDAGYRDVDKIRSFQHLFTENRIFPVHNIVYDTAKFYAYDGHGTAVLGCMASYVQDSIVGSAPKASYYLFITEDVRFESKLEEYNWAIAAQMADSIGVDMINSSLGYHQFNDASTNYTKQDMNGHTAISSIAASIAVEKGILVVNSAGNSGKDVWNIITAPADVEDVVSVGAVNREGQVADFSSRGYNAVGVIKPDIMAVGSGTCLYYHQGNYALGNGTSFAAPVMTGLIACYWQKNRSWTSAQIRKSIYESADNYNTPNRNIGFGKVDFDKATNPLPMILDTMKISVYPNPSQQTAIIEFNSNIENQNSKLEVYYMDKPVITLHPYWLKKGYNQVFLDIQNSPNGLYFLKIWIDNYYLSGRFVKN